MKRLITKLLCFSFLLVACNEKSAVTKTEKKIIENVNLEEYRKQYHVGEYVQDTLMFLNASIGARAAYDFVDKKGNEYRFGELLQDFDLILEKSEASNPKYLSKVFLVGHRLMISKSYDSEEFAGDKEIRIITTIEFLENEAPFKNINMLSEEEKLIEEYKKNYNYIYARYTDYSVGDLCHHIFKDKKGKEYDFISIEDRTYELSVSDPNSEYGEIMNAKYKNKYFHIFTKTKKMDPLGWGEPQDWEVIVKLVLSE